MLISCSAAKWRVASYSIPLVTTLLSKAKGPNFQKPQCSARTAGVTLPPTRAKRVRSLENVLHCVKSSPLAFQLLYRKPARLPASSPVLPKQHPLWPFKIIAQVQPSKKRQHESLIQPLKELNFKMSWVPNYFYREEKVLCSIVIITFSLF